MSNVPENGPFLPPAWQYPEQTETVKSKLETREAITAYYLNQREVANYALQPVATGQQWPPSNVSGDVRYSIRVVVPIPQVLAGINTYAHGIPVKYTNPTLPQPPNPTFLPADLRYVTRLYGSLANVSILSPIPGVVGPDPDYFRYLPLPYVSNAGAGIELYIEGPNVVLDAAIGYPGYSGYVVIEYLTES